MRSLKNRRLLNDAVSLACESLESRRLFSIGASITNGVVNIYGSSLGDTVAVKDTGKLLTVVVNSREFKFFNASVTKFVANLLGGNNTFTMDSSLSRPVSLIAGAGNDTITTGKGADTIYAGGGNDKITGGDGKDYIRGEDGNDIINGNGSDDDLSGGNGKDNLFGGSGNDVLRAESKSDSADFYDGGDGVDTMDYSENTTGVVITNDGIANDGKAPASGYTSTEKDNVLPNIENFTGSYYGGDRIKIIGNGNNIINGQDGADSIDAGGGNDTIYGGYKNDTLIGGTGNDSIIGYTGNDSITGGDGDDALAGSDNNDTIKGGNGFDRISGGNGDDSLYGEAGNDTITGDAGFDRMFGGIGSDTLYSFDNVYSEIVDGGGNGDLAYVDKLNIGSIRQPLDILIGITTWL